MICWDNVPRAPKREPQVRPLPLLPDSPHSIVDKPPMAKMRARAVQARAPGPRVPVPDILTFAPVRSRKLHSLSARIDGSPTRL